MIKITFGLATRVILTNVNIAAIHFICRDDFTDDEWLYWTAYWRASPESSPSTWGLTRTKLFIKGTCICIYGYVYKKVIYTRNCLGMLAAYAAVNKAILSTLHIHRTRNPNHLTKHVFCNFAIRGLDSKQIYSCNMSIWQKTQSFSSTINPLLLRVFVSLPM